MSAGSSAIDAKMPVVHSPGYGAFVLGPNNTTRIIRFGDFEIDLRVGELRKHGTRIRLQEQPFQILAMLLERPGEVVTREQLREKLWSNDTFVDFDHGLNNAINRLRDALSESGEGRRYIETLPRRGYRFIALIDKAAPAAVQAATPPRPWGERVALATALLVAIGLAGGIVWILRRTPKAPEALAIPVPLITYPGFASAPSFSPDGNQVAFFWQGKNRDAGSDIYVKLIGTSGPPLQLTTDPRSDFDPAWSPDGRFIAFLRFVPPKTAEVLIIPALGGPERKVGEKFHALTSFLDEIAGPDLTWSPDGNWLVVSDRPSSTEPVALFLMSIETGEKHRLTSPPALVAGDGTPAFSPDGRTLAFSRCIDANINDLYVLEFSDGLKPVGEPRRITFRNRGATAPAWTNDGREIVFSSGGYLSQPDIWRLAVSTSHERPAEPRRLASLGDNVFGPAISPRGNRLAYHHVLFHRTIWRMAVPVSMSKATVTEARSRNSPTPIISSTRDDFAPRFSPDGTKIVFVSARSGNAEIWVCNADGSNSIQLTSFGADSAAPRWSPDGARIAFASNAAGGYDIWVVDANAGKPRRMSTPAANDGNPSWSRDGRWIYFDSMRTGSQQVWRMPAGGGEAIRLTEDGGVAPLESPDGKFLYYSQWRYPASVWRMPVQGGAPTKVLDALSDFKNLAIADTGLYFIPRRGFAEGASIQFLSFTTNQVRPVARLEKPIYAGLTGAGGGLSVSPDGRWILYTQVDQADFELMMVENFH